MELRAHKEQKGYEKYTIDLIGYFTPEEQQAISRANLWQTSPVSFAADFGAFRNTLRYYPKYFQFLPPGFHLTGFTEYFADRFIKRLETEVEPKIRDQIAALVRAHQVQQRDAFFFGGFTGHIIDITPGSPPVPVPIQTSFPFPPAPRGLPLIGRQPLDVPTRIFSRINLADFVQAQVAPSPIAVPQVDELTWHFDDPQHENDHEVRLYAVCSARERARIIKYGLNHHSFGEVPVFDEDALERLRHAQEHELAGTGDPTVRASLRIEHQAQLKIAQEAKADTTIEDFMRYPFVKAYPNRYLATQGQRKMNGAMMEIKKMLDSYND